MKSTMPIANRSDPHRRKFAPGEVVFEQNAPGDVAYIIERGHVTVTRRRGGRAIDIASLGIGEIVGESALIDDHPRTATATATVETEVFIVERDLLQRHLGKADPLIAMLVRVLIDRLRTVQHRLIPFEEDESSYPPDERRRARRLAAPEALALGDFKREHELKRGIARGEFDLTLQPILRLADRRLAGFEALMVWRHPSLGRLAPADFIDLAERSGLVRELDELALRSAISALHEIERAVGGRARELSFSVNLSGVHAGQAATVTWIGDVLAETGTPPDRLTLEITESWLVGDPEAAVQTLRALKDLGLRLALDDFGTGYSGLAYLHSFPLDFLKVDRGFISGLPGDARGARIAEAIIRLADTFGLAAVAEGIDDPRQLEALDAMGCALGQGFLFSRPLDLSDAIDYARRGASPPTVSTGLESG